MRIALLEDDLDQAKYLQLTLEAAGHECRHFATGAGIIAALKETPFDLVILDWVVPDLSGEEVLLWLREHVGWHLPVLFVTLRDSEDDIVHVLQRGADDYMVKPVGRMEILARINALWRRAHPPQARGGVLECSPYAVDLNRHEVSRAGEPIVLTQKEFDLALFLFRNAGRALSRDELLERVWGRSGELHTRTVDTHMSRIRQKLGLSGEFGWSLNTIYQYGYRLIHNEDGTPRTIN